MRLLLCGVRGSMASPGFAFARTGGNTSCVAIEAADGRLLLLDAGTGIRHLAAELDGAPLRGSILLTHLHWDHVQGLPFLPNADRPDAEVALHLPRQGDGDAATLLAGMMAPPFFPITPDALRGTWSHHMLEVGVHQIEGFEVTAAEIHHKGGRTFGFRVADATGSIAYLPDHAPATAPADRLASAVALARGADVLLHDAQFLPAEQHLADAFGHATTSDVMAFATSAHVGRVVLIHHAPGRTDEQIDRLAAELPTGSVPLSVGCEGDRILVGSEDQQR